jgi:protease-4
MKFEADKFINWFRGNIKLLLSGVFGFIVIVSFVLSAIFLFEIFSEDYDSYDEYGEEEYSGGGGCNVSGFEIFGEIATYNYMEDSEADISFSSDIAYYIDELKNDNSIKGIILEVDSYGGSAVAGEEIAEALKRLDKPSVVVIKDAALSAAYLLASGADAIFASNYSDVGSIGITMSYLDYSESNRREGINYISLSTGKYKDSGDPDKPLSLEEKKLFMRDLNIMHDNFVEAVAENRNLEIEKVRAMADGSSMMGEMALENGLIDRIGGFYEAKEYLKEQIGEEVNVCW